MAMESAADLTEGSIDFKDLTLGEEAGRGEYGIVFKGSYFGQGAAIKLLKGTTNSEGRKYAVREVEALKILRFPRVVGFFGVCTHEGQTYLVTEWVPGGDLQQFVTGEKKANYTRKANMFLDVLYALEYLHKNDCIHRDLKPANLLLEEDGHVKICDMGLVRHVDKNKRGQMTYAGTEPYLSPEVILGMEYGKEVDIFSFGVVMAELLMERPIPERKPMDRFEFKMYPDPDSPEKLLKDDCPEILKKLMLKCISYEAEDRPSLKEIEASLKEFISSEDCKSKKDPTVIVERNHDGITTEKISNMAPEDVQTASPKISKKKDDGSRRPEKKDGKKRHKTKTEVGKKDGESLSHSTGAHSTSAQVPSKKSPPSPRTTKGHSTSTSPASDRKAENGIKSRTTPSPNGNTSGKVGIEKRSGKGSTGLDSPTSQRKSKAGGDTKVHRSKRKDV